MKRKESDMTLHQLENIPHIHDRMTFGKYKGETLFNVIRENPSYIVWCIKNVKGFAIDRSLKNELLRQHRKWLRGKERTLYDRLVDGLKERDGSGVSEAMDIIDNMEIPENF